MGIYYETYVCPDLEITEATGTAPLPKGAIAQVKFAKVQEGDVVNRNGRIYPWPILKKQGQAFQKEIKNQTSWMCYGHPPQDDPDGFSTECALLSELVVDDDNRVLGPATALIADTSEGRNLLAKLRLGKVATSSRGPGTLSQKEYVTKSGQKVAAQVMGEDYQLKGFDFVRHNSVPGTEAVSVREEEELGGKDMTIEELKTKHPDLYEQVLALGRDQAAAVVDQKIEEAAIDIAHAMIETGEYVAQEDYQALLTQIEEAGYVAIGEDEHLEDDDNTDAPAEENVEGNKKMQTEAAVTTAVTEATKKLRNELEVERKARISLESLVQQEVAAREASEAAAYIATCISETVAPELIMSWITADGGAKNVEEAKEMLRVANERAKQVVEHCVGRKGGNPGAIRLEHVEDTAAEETSRTQRRLRMLAGLKK